MEECKSNAFIHFCPDHQCAIMIDFHFSEERQSGRPECQHGWYYRNDLTIYEYGHLFMKMIENCF